MTFWFKSCPKCEGDLMLVREMESQEVECMQCGRQLPQAEIRVLLRYGTLAADTLKNSAIDETAHIA